MTERQPLLTQGVMSSSHFCKQPAQFNWGSGVSVVQAPISYLFSVGPSIDHALDGTLMPSDNSGKTNKHNIN